jgi:hypothetical protein
VSAEEGEGKKKMKMLEILFTIIIFIAIIYTAIPTVIFAYCVLEPQHIDNERVASNIVADIEEIKAICQPVPLYKNATYQPKTMAQLRTVLEVCNPPQPYSKSFDCSELSAYTEYYLENNGFNTTISASFTEGHAWCTVNNIIGSDVVQVECIPPVHISGTLPPVEVSYNNITEALAGDYPYEFDWWSN